jgi:hypothetical protein
MWINLLLAFQFENNVCTNQFNSYYFCKFISLGGMFYCIIIPFCLVLHFSYLCYQASLEDEKRYGKNRIRTLSTKFELIHVYISSWAPFPFKTVFKGKFYLEIRIIWYHSWHHIEYLGSAESLTSE